MDLEELHSILVIGLDVTALAISTIDAGYTVYAVDYFGDQDLKRVCTQNLSILKQQPGATCGFLHAFDPKDLIPLVTKLLDATQIEAALISQGFDDSPDLIDILADQIPVLGNSSDTIKMVRDKMNFFRELNRLGISHPVTNIASSLREAKQVTKDMEYPVVIKPCRGFAGTAVSKITSPQELNRAFKRTIHFDSEVLIQQFIQGTPASASIISTPMHAITLSLNEQLLGIAVTGQNEMFGYSGNIAPLAASQEIQDACKRTVEEVSVHFGLIGSNGVDLVISEEGIPYVIEVNPRFQGTLECVEKVLNFNIVEAHIAAHVLGNLPLLNQGPSNFCTRLILYAPYRSIIPDLEYTPAFSMLRDIPAPGVIVEKGEPVCSIVINGPTKPFVLSRALTCAQLIKSLLRPQK